MADPTRQGSLDPLNDLLGDLIAVAGLAGEHRLTIPEGDEQKACDLPLLLAVLTKGFLDQLMQYRSSTTGDLSLHLTPSPAHPQAGWLSRFRRAQSC